LIIIAVSYDATSLNARMQSLQRLGHIVVTASSLDAGRRVIHDFYHVLLIGATVPQLDRENLASFSRALRPQSKIISVEFSDSPRLQVADRYLKAGEETAILLAISALSGDSESDIEERRR
jgi:O-acetylhomoserine/O-acetylserine sulfhydrylase-like pyridoxal-dependent enzyme